MGGKERVRGEKQRSANDVSSPSLTHIYTSTRIAPRQCISTLKEFQQGRCYFSDLDRHDFIPTKSGRRPV